MTESPLHVTSPCQETPVINEGQDTSTNKTHLFNWLYDMTVQTPREEGGEGVRQMCAVSVCACVCVCLTGCCPCARDA